MNPDERGNLSLFRTWARAIRAIWNSDARGALAGGEFIASHIQMIPCWMLTISEVFSVVMGLI
tara:strand:- start:2378 stop:2566 length:189 start_codon:yes stop_codon:yes gene_type:complete